MNKNDLGIDISENNGYIDFEKLKNTGVKFIIIRIGWIGNKNNHTIDTYFEDYYERGKRSGYKIGFYVYNYCNNLSAIQNACDWILHKIKGKSIELPIFLDMEDTSIISSGKDMLTSMSKYFCDFFRNYGYDSGVYANKNWFTNYLDINSLLDYKIWLAEWNDKITFKYKVDLWQYSSNYMFNGKRFDINKCMCECSEKNKMEVYVNMKAFINNTNFNSLVFCDSNCTKAIGSLNKGEKCEAIGIFENGKGERVVAVIYTIDNSRPVNRKIGYLKLINGKVA